MAHFRAKIEGSDFALTLDGTELIAGFYATVFVEGRTREDVVATATSIGYDEAAKRKASKMGTIEVVDVKRVGLLAWLRRPRRVGLIFFPMGGDPTS